MAIQGDPMKKIVLVAAVAALISSCATLGKPTSPQEGVLFVKVDVQNPDDVPTETSFKLNFQDGVPSIELTPQKKVFMFKRNYQPTTTVTSYQTFNTHGWQGADTSKQPYFVPLEIAPGQIGIFKDKLVLLFMKGEDKRSYTYRYNWVPLTNQERANIVREVENNPDFQNWTWAPSAVSGLRKR